MKRTKKGRSGPFRQLNTHYRIVFIDDESLEEVSSFRLTMGKLYILLSTIFVVVSLIIVVIVLATPLKYYIPGYGSDKTRMQMVRLKQNVDSLSDMVAAQARYEENIRNIVAGKKPVKQDTAQLNMKKVRQDEMNSMLPATAEIKKDAIEAVKKENRQRNK